MNIRLVALLTGAALAAGLAAQAAAPAGAPAAKPAPAAAPKPAATATTAAAKPAGPSDKAQIEALEKRYLAAFNAKDVKAIMANYAPGDGLFVFDVTPPRQHVGWDDYRQDWEGLFKAFSGPIKVEMTDLSITVAGAVAYGHNIEPGEFTTADGTKTPITVRVSDVYRKLNGHWRIVEEHVSVPVDLATGKADLLSKP